MRSCIVCGKPSFGLLCKEHYSAGKAHDKVVQPVPAEDLEKRREGREVKK